MLSNSRNVIGRFNSDKCFIGKLLLWSEESKTDCFFKKLNIKSWTKKFHNNDT